MQIDPTRWLVALAGFTYDWIITREWKSILLAMIPLFLLVSVAGLVWTGSRLDRRELAAWYMELGDKEIAEWEASWAPPVREPVDPNADSSEAAVEGGVSPVKTDEDASETSKERVEVSRFAEVLFRRVQLLEPSDQSQFVIGATLAQRGAFEQAVKMLTKIAPDTSSGFSKAHAFLTMIYMEQFAATRDQALLSLIKHHAEMAAGWNRAPDEVLKAGSDLHWQTFVEMQKLSERTVKRPDGSEEFVIDQEYKQRGQAASKASLDLLEQAAERNPDLYLELTKRAIAAGSVLMQGQAKEKAELHFKRKLAANEKDDIARANLADLYRIQDGGNLERAETVLRQGEQTEINLRALSDLYRLRFRQSYAQQGDTFEINIELLDRVLELDPANPGIAEEVAWLMRVGGVTHDEALISKFQHFLAEGKATTATHALLSEVYLLKKDFKTALVHLEQVTTRRPNAAQYLNNLAFVLADLHPERIEESLEYAQRAVTASRNEPNADFYDTLGTIYGKMGKNKEAIAAFETAIQLDYSRLDFHERVAEQYRILGNKEMAAAHDDVIANLRQRQASKLSEESAVPQKKVEPQGCNRHSGLEWQNCYRNRLYQHCLQIAKCSGRFSAAGMM